MKGTRAQGLDSVEKSAGGANTPLFLSVCGDVEKGGLEAATRTRTLTPPNPKTIWYSPLPATLKTTPKTPLT